MEILLKMYHLGRSQNNAQKIHDEFETLLSKYFPGDRGAISLYNPQLNLLECVLDWGGSSIISKNFHPDTCKAFSSGKKELYKNELPEFINEDLEGILFQIPLSLKGDYIGVLSLSSAAQLESDINEKEEFWKASCTKLANALGVQVLALPGFERFKAFNIRDGATSLFNRQYMEETLEREVAAAKRRGTPIGVMKVKVDGFVELEAKYGEHTCDRLMWEISGKLPQFIRTEDIPSRYEKDTFVVILPGASLAISLDRAEKVRLELDQNSFFIDGAFINVTVSAGVCAMTDHGSEGKLLLSRAGAIIKKIQAKGGNMVGSPRRIDVKEKPKMTKAKDLKKLEEVNTTKLNQIVTVEAKVKVQSSEFSFSDL
jgi:diguanylate cyclase (GGDEF)-like protein